MVKKIFSKVLSVLLALLVALCCIVMVKNAMGVEPTVFGCRFFYIVTGSMEPTIPVGAAVLVHKNTDGNYEIGDVITFQSTNSQIAGQPNTHRIIDKTDMDGKYWYATKGDANNSPDAEPVSQDSVYGKVIWSTGKMTWVGTFLGMLTTPMGFFSCIMIPIMVIAGIMIKDFTKAYKQAVDEEAKEDAEAALVQQNAAAAPAQETAEQTAAAAETAAVETAETQETKS